MAPNIPGCLLDLIAYQTLLPTVPIAYQTLLPTVPIAYQTLLPTVPIAYQTLLPTVPIAYCPDCLPDLIAYCPDCLPDLIVYCPDYLPDLIAYCPDYLPDLIAYYTSQKKLPRKMKSRLVIIECAGYICWQLFLRRLHIHTYLCFRIAMSKSRIVDYMINLKFLLCSNLQLNERSIDE